MPDKTRDQFLLEIDHIIKVAQSCTTIFQAIATGSWVDNYVARNLDLPIDLRDKVLSECNATLNYWSIT